MSPRFLLKVALLGRWGFPCLLAATVAGCQREAIRVYEAPKDAPASELAGNDAPVHRMDANTRPEVVWKLPAGWQQIAAGEISQAAFGVTNSSGAEAQASITLLPGLAGKEAMVVNMWRQQAGLGALSDEAALKELQSVAVGTEKGSLFEVAGTRETEVAGQKKGQAVEILTAFVHHPEGSWFFKISGDASLVAGQKPSFLEFLKSIEFKAPPAGQPVVAAPELSGAAAFNWTVPANWKAEAPGQMQVARFAVSHNGRAATEVFVSVFDNDTGGMLANVNRWLRLVDLTNSMAEAGMPQITSPLDATLPGALLVDVSNNNKRLVGAIVPREGKFWFYRMLGEPAVLATVKDSFVAFAKSKP